MQPVWRPLLTTAVDEMHVVAGRAGPCRESLEGSSRVLALAVPATRVSCTALRSVPRTGHSPLHRPVEVDDGVAKKQKVSFQKRPPYTSGTLTLVLYSE